MLKYDKKHAQRWIKFSRILNDFYFPTRHTWSFIKGNSNFPTTRIVEPPGTVASTIDSEGALKFDAWRAAAFTFPYKTRIAQFPAEARIISVSNKIQRQTLAGNARFLLTTEGATLCRPPLLPCAPVSAPDPILFIIPLSLPLTALLVPHSSKHCAK